MLNENKKNDKIFMRLFIAPSRWGELKNCFQHRKNGVKNNGG